MPLSDDLLSQFAKATVDKKKNDEGTTVLGTTVEVDGTMYVRLDGSERLTPISTTTKVKPNERVTVAIKNHTATATGNLSSPAARSGDVDDIVDQIAEFEIVIADKVSTNELEAQVARINDLTADNVVIKESLAASEAVIGELEADTATIKGALTATNAKVENLDATKLDASMADITYATIEKLEAVDGDFRNLESDFGNFKILSSDKFTAVDASIEDLDAKKLSAVDADLKYANIDFANIGEAAIEKLFSDSGIIKDLIVSDGHITGELVGVTIKGDLIEGGTVVADKLVVKGLDGLYYKLNTDGVSTEAEQTEYNSLNGSVITAKSITATKISVDDLVAFDATIGGFNITDHSLYSGVKSAIDNTTRGVYLDKEGQIAFGDADNYIKYYKDESDGNYKIAIAAHDITLSGTNISIETTIDDLKNEVNTLRDEAIKSTQEQFYQSTSPTELAGGYWSTTQPKWEEGVYLWRRTLVTYASGATAYTPSLIGVCITGNSGTAGSTGVGIASVADRFYRSTSNTELVGGSWSTSLPTWQQGTYIWTRYQITYTDGSTEQTYPICVTGPTGNNGSDGVGVESVDVFYAKTTSNTVAPTTGWVTDSPAWENGKYIWSKTITKYTNNTSVESAPACITGGKGSTGDKGDPGVGIVSITEQYYQSTSTTTQAGGSWVNTYPAWVNGKYLWTRSNITYTDGTTKQTSPICVTGSKGATGNPGADGVGVTDVDVFYAKTTSNTTAPTSGWVTTSPAWENGKYIWSKTVTTYTDKSTAESAPACITGAQGPTGAKGVGVTSIVEQYYQSTSATSQNGGSWVNSYPTWVDGKYLWTRSNITYTDGSTKQTSPICVTGAKGAAGIGIKDVDVLYAKTTSATTAPTTGWVTTSPAWENGKYIWSKTVTTYTNGTSVESAPACITGQKGPTGGTGKPGVGITRIEEQYYQSTSATTLTGGSWSLEYPPWVNGKYLWTRSIIFYDNEDEVATEPICVTGHKGSAGEKGDPGIDFSQGKMLHADPLFTSGTNDCSVYNNNSNGTVSVNRAAKSADNPMVGTNYELVIKNTGSASPSCGGYLQNIQSRANAVFVRRIIAKIPVGRNLQAIQDSMGNGFKLEWLTSNAGTGTYQEYLYKYTCGSAGTFQTGGHVYIDGPVGTTAAPVIWYVAYSTTFDMTNVPDITSTTNMVKYTYGTCATAAATAAKVVTISNFLLYTGATISVKFTYSNTTVNPTLNVSGTGAKPIYTNGVRYAYWTAGASVLFTYDGANWQVCSTPVYGNTATIGNPAGGNVYVDADSVDIRNGSTTLATFTKNDIRMSGDNLLFGTYSVKNTNYARLQSRPPFTISNIGGTAGGGGRVRLTQSSADLGFLYYSAMDALGTTYDAVVSVSDSTIKLTAGSIYIGSTEVSGDGSWVYSPGIASNKICTQSSSYYPVYGAKIVYSNVSAGTSGTVTINETAANFNYLEIFFRTNDGERNSTRIYQPNGKVANLTSARITATVGRGWVKSKQISISGTSLAYTGYAGESAMGMADGGGTNYVGGTLIYLVVGYR